MYTQASLRLELAKLYTSLGVSFMWEKNKAPITLDDIVRYCWTA